MFLLFCRCSFRYGCVLFAFRRFLFHIGGKEFCRGLSAFSNWGVSLTEWSVVVDRYNPELRLQIVVTI